MPGWGSEMALGRHLCTDPLDGKGTANSNTCH